MFGLFLTLLTVVKHDRGSKLHAPYTEWKIHTTISVSSNNNIYAPNIYSFLSKQAQSLLYPPGNDTAYYWGQGRYYITKYGFLNDAQKTNGEYIIENVYKIEQTNEIVIAYGLREMCIINISNETVNKMINSCVYTNK